MVVHSMTSVVLSSGSNGTVLTSAKPPAAVATWVVNPREWQIGQQTENYVNESHTVTDFTQM